MREDAARQPGPPDSSRDAEERPEEREGANRTLADNTDRKRVEETLRESEERFREAMEATTDGLWDWNVETGAVYYSPAYCRMLGYAPGEFSGLAQSWMDLIHAEDREQVLRANQDCIENRIPNFKIEFRMRTRSGGWKWILGRGRASVRDANGRSLRMIGTHEDITERKRVEDALRESEHRLRRITDNMLDMVVETDLQGVCKYVSQSGKAVLGYDPKELVGKSLFGFVHPEDLGTVTATIRRAISTGRLWTGGRFECRYRHADGRYVWLENLANIVRDEKGQMIGSVIASRDITERKESEEALRESEGKYRRLFEEAMDGIALADADTGIPARLQSGACSFSWQR